jgi:uncharacterized membrane protein
VSGPPEIVLFFGRLHPLLVHLPIGLILLLALLELLARRPALKHANSNAGLLLAFAVPMALATALCGWLLSLGGGYQDRLLQWHKWTGIATAAACVLAGLLYRLDLKKAYRFSLYSSVLVLIFASHFGGSLTHGSDYLVRYAPNPFRRWLSGPPQPPPVAPKPREVASLQAFGDLIDPVFQKDCAACHGPEKAKGKLRLDSLAGALKGGDSGPVIIAGKSADSALIKRLRLPIAHEDHMPPDGKPQPSLDDISLLQWWVDAGAPGDKKIGELKPPAHITSILASRFGTPPPLAKAVPPRPLDQALPLAAKLSDELHIAILGLSPKEPWLQCNAAVAGKDFGDAQLQQLAPLGSNLRWLDLAGTSVTDAGLARLPAMPNLVRLHLERTAITDSGLAALAGLVNLEYLDLYGTEVSDAGLETLEKLPKLKRLYIWRTKVTPEAATAFMEARTDQAQLQAWKDEIEQLQAKIRDAHIAVELGSIATPKPATNAAPVNAVCPVSGKPVDPSKTVVHEGEVIAFCCDDCKAQFLKDPKPFLAKISAVTSKETTSGTPK